MIAASMLDPALSSRLCLTLVHSLWQVALLAAIAWCCERVLRWSVERRCAMYVAAMFAGLALLPVTFALLDAGTPGAARGVQAGDSESQFVPAAVAAPSPAEVVAEEPTAAAATSPVMDEPDLSTRQIDVAPTDASTDVAAWTTLAPWIVTIYVAGVVLMLLRLGIGVWSAHRLVARSRPVGDSTILTRLEQLANRLSLRSRPVVAYSEQVVIPKIVGLLRPAILLPSSAMTGLSPGQLEMVLAHELAHLRRHDLWVNLLQRVAEAVLFFNPCLWTLSRRINLLREYACDEAVCRLADDASQDVRSEYAAALLQIAELSRTSTPSGRLRRAPNAADLTTLAASGRSPSQLRRRIARLVGEPLREPLHLSRGSLLLLAVALAVILSSPLWPVIAQTTETDGEAQQSDNTSDAEAQAPAGSRVEVIAMSTVAVKPQRWWDASGELIEPPAITWKPSRDVTGDARGWRRIVIRVHDLAENEEVRWEMPGIPQWWGADVTVDGEKSPPGYYLKHFVIPEGQQNLRMRVGIASGQWKTVAAFGTHNTIEIKDAEPSFISAGTFEEDGGTTLFLTHDAFQPNFRVVAIDKEGHTHDSGHRGGLSTGTKVYQSRITFRGLSREQIDHFEFQTRPYEWTEIDNLPLEPRADSRDAAADSDVDEAAERKRTAAGLRITPEVRGRSNEALIGELIERPNWKQAISFAPWQAEAILKLDNVLIEAWDASFIRDAEYIESGHDDYRRYVDRSRDRRNSVRYHGQQIVQLGLLTEAQAAFVMFAAYSRLEEYGSLNDRLVQSRLNLTSDQLAFLNKLNDWAVVEGLQLNHWTRDPAEKKSTQKERKRINEQHSAFALGVLSPEQLSLWNGLIAPKPKPGTPSEIPDLAQRKRGIAEEHLSLFTHLKTNREALGLTDRQDQHLADLEDVLRTGIALIRYREDELDSSEKGQRDIQQIVRHAEEIVLFAILSQEQEQQTRQQLRHALSDTSAILPPGERREWLELVQDHAADAPPATVPQKLEEVLREWEEKTARITHLRGEHRQYQYDEIFRIEKRAVGEFWYEAPDKARIDFNPAPLEDTQTGMPLVSRKSGASGQPYKLETVEPVTWLCDGKSIIQIEHETKTYSLEDIPPLHQKGTMMDSLLPILFGINPLGADADKWKMRYALSLGSQHNKTGSNGRTKYHIVALPLLQSDARTWQRAEIILDAETCLPNAVRLIAAAGSAETVYVFPLESMKANESDSGRNPFKLESRGYKLTSARSK
jgi:beta-lactamase regulating signal transducer with metallopeptidase domain